MSLDPSAEDCRYAVRHLLAVRHPAAYDAGTIRRLVAKGGEDYSLPRIEAALAFLAGLPEPQARFERAGLGTTRYWSATSAGVLADERGE